MNKRIIIIDDSEIVVGAATASLEAAGYSVMGVTDPSGFDPSADGAIDLILVDVNMPEVFGDDVVRFIKEAWGLEAPVLLFSDIDEAELQRRASESGADGFFCKKWGLDVLPARLTHYFA